MSSGYDLTLLALQRLSWQSQLCQSMWGNEKMNHHCANASAIFPDVKRWEGGGWRGRGCCLDARTRGRGSRTCHPCSVRTTSVAANSLQLSKSQPGVPRARAVRTSLRVATAGAPAALSAGNAWGGCAAAERFDFKSLTCFHDRVKHRNCDDVWLDQSIS